MPAPPLLENTESRMERELEYACSPSVLAFVTETRSAVKVTLGVNTHVVADDSDISQIDAACCVTEEGNAVVVRIGSKGAVNDHILDIQNRRPEAQRCLDSSTATAAHRIRVQHKVPKGDMNGKQHVPVVDVDSVGFAHGIDDSTCSAAVDGDVLVDAKRTVVCRVDRLNGPPHRSFLASR